jgi:putative ABC transport system permease protein
VTVWAIALATVRQRKAGFVAVFVAVLCGSTLLTALGVLFESGLRAGVPPQRYAGAAVVVGGAQALPLAEDIDPHFSERVPLPAEAVGKIAAVPDVDRAVGDVSVPVDLVSVRGSVVGHGWSSAVLTPFSLREGDAPTRADEVVLDAGLARRAGVGVGDGIDLALASGRGRYTVTGIAAPPGADRLGQQSVLFFTDGRAGLLSGRPDQVDAIGVLARPGVDPAALAERIRRALPATEIATYTGVDRGDVEFLEVGEARTRLLVLSLGLAATAIMITLLVVASTLALAIQQRRREFALLRAVGASGRQIHRMVGAEVGLVAGGAAILGAGPGVAVAYLLRSALAAGGVLPADFGLALSPLPAVAAILPCVAAAQVAGWVAARRPARISPVQALDESTVEPPALHRFRLGAGWAAAALGVAASGLPTLIPGEAAVAGAASSALLLVTAAALLGPRLIASAVRRIGGPLRRIAPVGGYLAAANTLANTRRLAAAVTPLVLAITIASVQIFSQTTISAAAAEQARKGVVADLVVASTGSGLGPRVTDAVRALDGVEVASPITRSRVLVPHLQAGKPKVASYAAQGVDPDRLARVLDLEPRLGSLDRLHGETVALSQLAAETLGVRVGSRIDLRLGDRTRTRPTVVAIYGRGLGFGDVTLPHDLLAAHTTLRSDQAILVRADAAADRAALASALRGLAADHPGLVVLDRDGLAAAGQAQRKAQNRPSLIALLVLLAYIAIAVVNTLVMATAARGREFALLRLIGTGRAQVVRMVRIESLLVVGLATAIGTLAAIPPLVGISLGLTESPIPSASAAVYAAILGATATLGFLAMGVPTRFALRSHPVDAIGLREWAPTGARTREGAIGHELMDARPRQRPRPTGRPIAAVRRHRRTPRI